MRYLGIDFGTKRVGIAISDETNSLAFPLTVLPNSPDLISEVVLLIKENQVTNVVVGESKDLSGKENPVMADIKFFVGELRKQVSVEIMLEPEFLTTIQASRIQGRHEKIDASAAAVILQNYLDTASNTL